MIWENKKKIISILWQKIKKNTEKSWKIRNFINYSTGDVFFYLRPSASWNLWKWRNLSISYFCSLYLPYKCIMMLKIRKGSNSFHTIKNKKIIDFPQTISEKNGRFWVIQICGCSKNLGVRFLHLPPTLPSEAIYLKIFTEPLMRSSPSNAQ